MKLAFSSSSISDSDSGKRHAARHEIVRIEEYQTDDSVSTCMRPPHGAGVAMRCNVRVSQYVQFQGSVLAVLPGFLVPRHLSLNPPDEESEGARREVRSSRSFGSLIGLWNLMR